MNYDDAFCMVDWLNERFRRAGMKPWYRWAVDMNWNKIRKWAVMLGYKGAIQ